MGHELDGGIDLEAYENVPAASVLPEPVARMWTAHGGRVCFEQIRPNYIDAAKATALYTAAQMQALADRLVECEKERDEAHEWIKDATTKITGLTAGGSEYFTRHGSAFWADIDFCVKRIRERYETSHGQVIKAHKRATTAEAALAEARKVIEPFAAAGEVVLYSERRGDDQIGLTDVWFYINSGYLHAVCQWLSANPKETK